MVTIRSKLKEVMENHDPKLSIRRLSKEINYHFDSVRRMYKDEMVQYPRDLLVKLCLYFHVQPGQLIGMDEDSEWDRTQEESIDHQGEGNVKELHQDENV